MRMAEEFIVSRYLLTFPRQELYRTLLVDQVSEAIIRYGSERLKQDLLPRAARGDITFWQGFSEPNAGSDLLSLQTSAVRDGESWGTAPAY